MIKKQKKNENYKLSFAYLKENKNYFFAILAIFLASFMAGFFYPVFFAEFIKNLMIELSERIKGMNFLQLFVFIIKNNLSVAFIGMLLGIVLGIAPIFLAFFNGYVLGFVSSKTVSATNFFVLFRLVPHGIFELPALVLSLGLGLKLGISVLVKNKKENFFSNLKNSLIVFIYVVLPLLIIAAIIETSLIFFWKSP